MQVSGLPTWIARVLALAAVTGMTLAVAAVIIASIGGSDEDAGANRSGAKHAGATGAAGCTPGAEKAVDAGYYVIKQGEDLNVVSDKTCIGVGRIKRLNPNLDPMALPTRGCVDLVKDGCKALAAEG